MPATDTATVPMLAGWLGAVDDRPPAVTKLAAALVQCGEREMARQVLFQGVDFGRDRHALGEVLPLREALAAVPRTTNQNQHGLRVNDCQSLRDHLDAYAVHRDLWFAGTGISPGALGPGSLWLDVGCAFGDLLCEMADRVVLPWDRQSDPDATSVGRMVGFDLNSEAVVQAAALIRERGLENVVSVRAAVPDVFPGIGQRTVDRIVITNTVQYFTDPVRTFRAYRNYLRPGGTIATKEMWWGGFAFFLHGKPIPHWDEVLGAYQKFEQRHLDENTWAGREQAGWLRLAGLTVVRDEALPIRLSILGPAAKRYYYNIINDVLLNDENQYLPRDVRRYIHELFSPENANNVLDREGVHVDDVEYLTVAQEPQSA